MSLCNKEPQLSNSIPRRINPLSVSVNDDDYVCIKASIPRSLSTKFRELVNLKHPMYQKGALSYEVEMALRQYIASYMTTPTHINTDTHSQQNDNLAIKAEQSNPNPKIYSLKKDILKYFIESQLYLEVPQFIPATHLIKAIAALKGIDQRTINKYLKLLEGFGCIKKSGLSQYEFV